MIPIIIELIIGNFFKPNFLLKLVANKTVRLCYDISSILEIHLHVECQILRLLDKKNGGVSIAFLVSAVKFSFINGTKSLKLPLFGYLKITTYQYSTQVPPLGKAG